MPKYIIEREIPGVSSADWKKISQKSSGVVRELAPNVQWVESFVTDDKVYCVYIAPDKGSILEHARRGGFPAGPDFGSPPDH